MCNNNLVFASEVNTEVCTEKFPVYLAISEILNSSIYPSKVSASE